MSLQCLTRLVLLVSVLVPIDDTGAGESPTGFVLTTEDYTAADLVPAFVGNGYLGARIPFDGQGYREKPVAALAEVQGLFAMGRLLPWGPKVERRASLPVWSTLDYDDGSGRFTLDSGKVERYRQSLDLRVGTLSTDIDWVSAAGRTVHLRYDITPDRVRPHAALVRLRFTPQFSGRVVVTDTIDPSTGRFVQPTRAGHQAATQYLDLQTEGLGVTATIASRLSSQDGDAAAIETPDGRVAQRIGVDVVAGRVYEVLKTVGVAVSTDAGASSPPRARAIDAAEREETLGYDGARQESDDAWKALWTADVAIEGDPALQRAARAALYALFAIARDDFAWAPSPTGLSSDGYLGHVFWDSETWMFPVYLATAPGIAGQLLQYRIDRLPAARTLASQTSGRGSRFPWESALSGDETVPIAGFGHELHISSDIALAAWQYWLATGDMAWLDRAYPLLAGIADFWVSDATVNPDGSRSIRNVLPPDEDVLAQGRLGWLSVLTGGGMLVDDDAYTTMTAARSLAIAAEAAKLLGRTPEGDWAETARTLRVLPVGAEGARPEYRGYGGGPIKQADVMLLSFPWEIDNSREVQQATLDYYAPRTNPNGPSMTDAIHSIVASAIGAPGCAAYSFTRRSADPFLRPPYSQFSETRVGGVLTFATGAGGFLQEFLYGYTGLRWRSDGLWLDPSLPPQLQAVTISAMQWRGRTFRIDVRAQGTTMTLISGTSMRVAWPDGAATLAPDTPVVLRTRLPATVSRGNAENANLALCRPAQDSARAGTDTSANDGSNATVWTATASGQSLTIDLEREVSLEAVTVTRPQVLALAGTALLGPAFARSTLLDLDRSAGEDVEISTDGKTWNRIGRVTAPAARDVLPANGVRARYLRIVAADASAQRPLVVGEVTATERTTR